MSSLKILWLTSNFPTDPDAGRNLYYWHPLQTLQKMGVEVIVLDTQGWKPGAKKIIQTKHFPIKIIQCFHLSIPRHYFRNISNYIYLKMISRVIKKLHRSHPFHLIHAHGEINGLAAVAMSNQLNLPSVVTIHGIDVCPRMWGGAAGKIFQRTLNQANRIIYVGEPLRKHFSKIIHLKKQGVVIHNGFRIPTQQRTHPIFTHLKKINLISVCLLQEGKGVDITIEALAQLKTHGIENWIYTIIGDGEQKKYYERRVDQLGLKEKIKFEGYCTHDTVYQHLQNADIFCLPSYREAFGIVYAEAMAHGLLTIGVREQGASELIEHEKTGLLVEPKNKGNLLDTLMFAINNIDTMRIIARAGREQVLKNFTWEKHAEKLVALYEDEIRNDFHIH